jgi:hypothetical protein
MRSAADLKDKWLALLPMIMSRTGMFGSTGGEIEGLCLRLLDDLCFLDERDEDTVAEVHGDRSRYGKLGTQGPFWEMFGRDRSCTPEVASVFAEYFHRLGYLTVERSTKRRGRR